METWQLLWKVGGKQEVRHRTWSRRGRPAPRSRWRGHSQTVPCSTSRRWRSADPGRGADLWANQTTASNLKKSLRSKVTLAAFERCGNCGGTLFHKFFVFFLINDLISIHHPFAHAYITIKHFCICQYYVDNYWILQRPIRCKCLVFHSYSINILSYLHFPYFFLVIIIFLPSLCNTFCCCNYANFPKLDW